MQSTREVYQTGGKRVYYLSLEFLIGRLMRDALANMGLMEEVAEALKSLNVDIDLIASLEPDAALGNGGLGRLAACFMESWRASTFRPMAMASATSTACSARRSRMAGRPNCPKPGLRTAIHGNSSAAKPTMKSASAAWSKPSTAKTMSSRAMSGSRNERVIAVAYDTPVVGWKAKRVNTLRLWEAQPIDPIRLDAFNSGDHVGALRDSVAAEAMTRVLYPADSHKAGQELRLRQEFFFSSASLQDILRRHRQQYPRFPATCPTRWRSSSTTPIRLSPWPN